jgi:hypothetical protein
LKTNETGSDPVTEKKEKTMKRIITLTTIMTIVFCNLVFAQVPAGPGDIQAPHLPNPRLDYTGRQAYEANGQKWVRYNLRVLNFSAYPAALFAAAPQLPACGANQNASRTWVKIYDAATGKELYGFCALNKPADLRGLWFSTKLGEPPPDCVYIVMTDRKLNKTYKSNKVCFDSHPPAGADDFTTKPGKADLKIGTFRFSVNPQKSLKVNVKNVGGALANICLLRLTVRKINGAIVNRTTEVKLPVIAAGQEAWVIIDATDILPNSVALKATTFRLVADATYVVTESNETNNAAYHN